MPPYQHLLHLNSEDPSFKILCQVAGPGNHLVEDPVGKKTQLCLVYPVSPLPTPNPHLCSSKFAALQSSDLVQSEPGNIFNGFTLNYLHSTLRLDKNEWRRILCSSVTWCSRDSANTYKERKTIILHLLCLISLEFPSWWAAKGIVYCWL